MALDIYNEILDDSQTKHPYENIENVNLKLQSVEPQFNYKFGPKHNQTRSGVIIKQALL